MTRNLLHHPQSVPITTRPRRRQDCLTGMEKEGLQEGHMRTQFPVALLSEFQTASEGNFTKRMGIDPDWRKT
jgi:hypothetical protein